MSATVDSYSQRKSFKSDFYDRRTRFRHWAVAEISLAKKVANEGPDSWPTNSFQQHADMSSLLRRSGAVSDGPARDSHSPAPNL